jgi:hypothetical protein
MDVRPVAVWYYPNTKNTDLLYLPYQYFPPKTKYWVVVCFYGALDNARIRGYLPIASLLVTAATKYKASAEPNVQIVEKGVRIGPGASDVAWTSMDAIPASFLVFQEPPVTDPAVLLYKEPGKAGTPQPIRTSSSAEQRLRKSAKVRASWGVGDKLDIKDDGAHARPLRREGVLDNHLPRAAAAAAQASGTPRPSRR